jgi:hypothetical protein
LLEKRSLGMMEWWNNGRMGKKKISNIPLFSPRRRLYEPEANFPDRLQHLTI